jgi:Fur family ferric uptake transcriptional regulator
MTVAPRSEPLRFHDIEDVAEAMRRDGGRLTTPRRLVLEALFAARRLVSADHIAAGTDTGTAIELASVYRTLERLEALGVVRHMHLGHGPGLYGLVGEGEREYLVCDACGKLTAADPERIEPLRAAIREQFGYDARFTHFPIHGLCLDCADRGGD